MFAKDIHDKYIDVPNTTDFGIMFLPVEGLYAEAVKAEYWNSYKENIKLILPDRQQWPRYLIHCKWLTLAIQNGAAKWNILGAENRV